MHEHFNQLVQEATGEYFVLLCDDDQISANFVTELVAVLERTSRSVACHIQPGDD